MNEKSYTRFLIIWAGQLLSSLGTGMTAFALGVHVFRTTGSATGFAMVILSLFLPSILLRPFGGVLADRFDRRLMIIAGDLGSAAGVLFILLNLLSGDLALWQIYLGVGFSSACNALQNPAYKASVTDLVNEEDYAKASGLVQLASSAQHLLAPAAAGFLMATGGITSVLMIDLGTFLAAVGTVAVIRRRLIPGENNEKMQILTDLAAGWHTLRAKRGIFGIVLIISLVTFFVGVLQTLFAPMLLTLTDARRLGLIQSISASGMLVSSLLIGIKGIPGDARRVLGLGVAGAGLFLAAMGVSTSLIAITLAFFFFFLCLPLINSSAELLIRTSIPNTQQGRVWGIIGLLSQTGYIAAYLSAGLLADRFFNPLLTDQGLLAGSLGRVIGSGPGRGIGLIFILCGGGLALTAAFYRFKRGAGAQPAAEGV